MKPLNIAIVGLPNSGKTALLTALCSRREHEPLNKETFDFEHEKCEFFKTGDWSKWAATNPAEKPKELKWSVQYHDFKYILESKDFAGEKWKEFIKTYGSYDSLKNIKKEKLTDVAKFISAASRIVVCIDLKDYIDNNNSDQQWCLYAIKHFAKQKKIPANNIVVVFTKYDKIEQFVNDKYKNLYNFLQIKGFTMLKDIYYFPISVADFKFDPQQQLNIPQAGSIAKNFGKLEKWLFSRITNKLLRSHIAGLHKTKRAIFHR